MAYPANIAFTFGSVTSALTSQLDQNFTNLQVGLNGIGNGSSVLSTVAITAGSHGSANIGSCFISNGTVTQVVISTETVTSSNISSLYASTANIGSLILGNVISSAANIGTLTSATLTLSGLSNNAVLIVSGSSNIAPVLPGASGNILTSNGTVWTSQPATTSGLTSKVIQIGRDPSSADGSVSYTGTGFQPTSLHAMWVQGTENIGIGSSDSSKASYCLWLNNSVAAFDGTGFIALGNSADNPSTTRDVATISSYDPNGFTLIWTHTGTPSAGNIQGIIVTCYK